MWKDTERTAPPCNHRSIKHSWDANFSCSRPYESTLVSVVNADLIDVGRSYLSDNPLVLNLADDSFPGGCVYTGSGAAEESIFRRSNYFRTLTIDHYPLKNDEAVYSPRVTVFKEGPAHDFARCEPFDLSLIACPGIRHPPLQEDGRMRPSDIAVLERKIELIFQIACIHGHKVIVLGALGCGAWKNNPLDVAETFKRVIARFNGLFERVVFAILQGAAAGYTTVLGSDRLNNFTTFSVIFSAL